MLAYTHCPICENKLNKKFLPEHHINDLDGYEFTQHYCKYGINHYFSSLSQNDQIQNILLTINYNITVRLNYQKETSIVFIQHSLNNTQTIEVPKLLEADFPKLIKLKDTIHLYIIFL